MKRYKLASLDKINGPMIFSMPVHFFAETSSGGIIMTVYTLQEAYFKEGYLHRVDGPATIHQNGDEVWFIDGYDFSNSLKEMLNEDVIPLWKDWTDDQKILLRLRFS